MVEGRCAACVARAVAGAQWACAALGVSLTRVAIITCVADLHA